MMTHSRQTYYQASLACIPCGCQYEGIIVRMGDGDCYPPCPECSSSAALALTVSEIPAIEAYLAPVSAAGFSWRSAIGWPGSDAYKRRKARLHQKRATR